MDLIENTAAYLPEEWKWDVTFNGEFTLQCLLDLINCLICFARFKLFYACWIKYKIGSKKCFILHVGTTMAQWGGFLPHSSRVLGLILTVWSFACSLCLFEVFFWVLQLSNLLAMNLCVPVHEALRWTGVPSTMYSHPHTRIQICLNPNQAKALAKDARWLFHSLVWNHIMKL